MARKITHTKRGTYYNGPTGRRKVSDPLGSLLFSAAKTISKSSKSSKTRKTSAGYNSYSSYSSGSNEGASSAGCIARWCMWSAWSAGRSRAARPCRGLCCRTGNGTRRMSRARCRWRSARGSGGWPKGSRR